MGSYFSRSQFLLHVLFWVGIWGFGFAMGDLFRIYLQERKARRREADDQVRHNRDTERNVLSRFKNAIEFYYPGKFMADKLPKSRPSGGSWIVIQRPDYTGLSLTISVNMTASEQEIGLNIGGHRSYYPSCEYEKALQYIVGHLLRNL